MGSMPRWCAPQYLFSVADGSIHGSRQSSETVLNRFLGDAQRRSDLDASASHAYRGEKHEATAVALFNDGMGEVGIRGFGARVHYLQPCNKALPVHASDLLRVSSLYAQQARQQHIPESSCVLHKPFAKNGLDTCQRSPAADRIA